jgi:hypothetical protein
MMIAALFQADARYVSMHLDPGPERFPKNKRSLKGLRNMPIAARRTLRATHRHR